jgi:hypothetical protein
MNSKKSKITHLDQLLSEAENPSKLTTTPEFEERLFAKIDAVDSLQVSKKAMFFSLSSVRKYAAVILILVLNISAVLIYSSFLDSDQSSEDITEYSDEYFPDYASLTYLE